MTEIEEDIKEETVDPIEIIDKTPDKPEKDNTSWEEPDPWAFTTMTEEDIAEAEESRNA